MTALSKPRGFFLSCIFLLIYAGMADAVDNPGHYNHPVINRFNLPGYVNYQEITDVAFDQNGIVYLASDARLSIFNGSVWNYVSTSGKTLVTVTSDNEIMISDNNGPGILTTDSLLHYTITGREDILPVEMKDWKRVTQMTGLQDKVYFIVDGKLFSLTSDRLKEISRAGKNPSMIKTANKLIISSSRGIAFIDNKTGEPSFVSELPRYDMIRKGSSGYLAYDPKRNQFNILNDSLQITGFWQSRITGKVSDFIYNNGYYFILANDLGLFIADTTGKIINSLPDTPFSNHSVINRFIISPYGQVWLIQDHGIHVIDFPSCFYEIKPPADKGDIEDVGFADNTLYVATDRGLFRFENNYTPVLNKPVFKILKFNDVLVASDSKGLWFVRDGKADSYPVPSFHDIGISPSSGELVLATDSGLEILTQHNAAIEPSFFKTVSSPARFVVSGDSLFYTAGRQFFIQDAKNGSSTAFNLPGDPDAGRVKQLFWWNGKLHLLLDNEIYYFESGKFKRRSDPDNNFPNSDIISILVLNNKEIVLNIKNDWNEAELVLFNAETDTACNLPNPLRVSPYAIRMRKANDSTFLLTDNRRIYLQNTRIHKKEGIFHPVITGIIAGNDTILNQASYQIARVGIRNKLNNIAYSNNDLTVVFSTTDFLPGLKKHQYRFRSHGKWSPWKLGNVLKLEDLKEGNYVIDIRFMNNEGVVSAPASLRFIIKPPFYTTWIAWVLYFIFGFILFFILYKTYRYRTHKLNIAPAGENQEMFHEAEIREPAKNYQFVSNIDQEKKSRKTKWDKYEMATVLFSDIQGFTRIAEQMNPEHLIDELDKFFFHFDSVVEKYNIEKIKTIGDAYMAAGGIPKKNSTNPIEVVLAALEMQQYMRQLKNTNVDIWDLRIGIHSGPVIAGTIGQKKRSYDIWGDTVNTASRMESSGEAGKVNVSGTTYNLIRDYFICEYRGRLPVKYKGNIDMYFVRGLRPELSINLAGIPNRKFFLKLQLLRLTDLEEYVYDRLEVELPNNMYFHNLSYARQIYSYAELLCKAENLDLEETLMIRTASLLLPLGYIDSYERPEKGAVEICANVLTDYFYTEKQVNLISNLILSTKWPPTPQNLLEEIMADTRMEYLGRVDFIKLYKLLFLENNEYLEPMEIREWKQNQINILSTFSFFTAGAKRLREIDAEEQIRKLEEDNL